MPASQTTTAPQLDLYERNRQLLTAAELGPYEEHWVAFSLDGKRVIAAAPSLIELDRRVVALGENHEHVGLEFLCADDCSLGSAGLRG